MYYALLARLMRSLNRLRLSWFESKVISGCHWTATILCSSDSKPSMSLSLLYAVTVKFLPRSRIAWWWKELMSVFFPNAL